MYWSNHTIPGSMSDNFHSPSAMKMQCATASVSNWWSYFFLQKIVFIQFLKCRQLTKDWAKYKQHGEGNYLGYSQKSQQNIWYWNELLSGIDMYNDKMLSMLSKDKNFKHANLHFWVKETVCTMVGVLPTFHIKMNPSISAHHRINTHKLELDVHQFKIAAFGD